MRARVQYVDGNALAGVLAEFMDRDASTLTVTCRHCGLHGDLAEVRVERDDTGSIVRCHGCARTLLVVLRDAEGGIRLRLEGAIEIAAS